MNRWTRSDKCSRLSRLLADARFLADPNCDEEAAPFWHGDMSEGRESGLDGPRKRFKNRLRRNETLRRKWSMLDARRAHLDSDNSAREHFESVSGHRLDDFSWMMDRDEVVAPDENPELPLRERPRRRIPGRFTAGRLVTAASLVVAVSVSATLGFMPRPSDPFRTETSSLSGYLWDEVGERTRRFHTMDMDPEGKDAAGTISYADAMAQARRSRTVHFGVMERYDREGLLLARRMLEEARRVDTGYPEPIQVERMTQVLDSLIMHTY